MEKNSKLVGISRRGWLVIGLMALAVTLLGSTLVFLTYQNNVAESRKQSYIISQDSHVWKVEIDETEGMKINSSSLESLELTTGESSFLLIEGTFNQALSWVNSEDVVDLGEYPGLISEGHLYRVRTGELTYVYTDRHLDSCLSIHLQGENLVSYDTVCAGSTISNLSVSVLCTSSTPPDCDALLKNINVEPLGIVPQRSDSNIEFQHQNPYFRFRYPDSMDLLSWEEGINRADKITRPSYSLHLKDRNEDYALQEIAIFVKNAKDPQSWIENGLVDSATSLIGEPYVTSINDLQVMQVDANVTGVQVREYIYDLPNDLVLVIVETYPGKLPQQDKAFDQITKTLTIDEASLINY